MIRGGGYANIRNANNEPTNSALTVEEKRIWCLIDMINIKDIVIRAFPSINPGEPPIHLNELIQNTNQIRSIKSPGNTKEKTKSPISGVNFKISIEIVELKIVKEFKSKIEDTTKIAAISCNISCTFAGRFMTSSRIPPIIKIPNPMMNG